MKISRLLGILNVLVNKDRVTVKELAERFEVSKRTIFRDLDTLNEAGIPIVSYSGIGGGVSVIEGYKYNKSLFSKSDINKLKEYEYFNIILLRNVMFQKIKLKRF